MATVSVKNGRLWYDVTGEGPPLVCLHGGWMDGDAWLPQVERFADQYRVIRTDLRGHGRTGPTDRRRYTIDLLTDDVEQLLDHLDVERPVLCGLSLGSLVTQNYLHRHPEAPESAILGGPLRSMPPIDLPTPLKRMTSPAPGLRTSLALAGSKLTFRSLLSSIRAAQGRPWLSVSDETRAKAIQAAGQMSRREFRKVFEAIYRHEPPHLGEVTAPVLAIYGRHEAGPLKRQGRQIAMAVESGSIATVPDAAHLVNLDNPSAFNDAVANFLAHHGT